MFDRPGTPCPVKSTAGFAYFRFHGMAGTHAGKHTDDALDAWAGRIKDLAHDLDAVFVYFNNDAFGNALRNAETLRQMLA